MPIVGLMDHLFITFSIIAAVPLMQRSSRLLVCLYISLKLALFQTHEGAILGEITPIKEMLEKAS